MRANHTRSITPRLRALTDDQKETIFLSALEVLEHTGIRVDNNDEDLELFSSAGAYWPAPACLCPFVACKGA